MRFSDLIFSLALWLPAAAAAQDAGIAVPGMGFVFDAAAGAIRPIRGIPGAALVREPLDVGFAIRSAAISPQQDFALAVSIGDGRVRMVLLNNAQTREYDGLLYSPDAILFSPSGHAAVLYNQSSGFLQILTGLPGAVVVHAPQVSTLSASTLAIADDGILMSAGQDAGWPSSIVALAFRRNSQDLLAVSNLGHLYLAQNLGGVPEFRQIYVGGDETANAIAVQFSNDGVTAYTANATGSITAVDLATGSAQTISCRCRPDSLQPMASGRLFRLTGIFGAPPMLLDVSTNEPRIWFVPLVDAAGGAQ